MAGQLQPRAVGKQGPAAEGATGIEPALAVGGDRRHGQDLHFQAPFHRSIRFRLTAWYASALILVIVALSVSLHTLLVRTLTNDVESRLANAATEIAPVIRVAESQVESADPAGTVEDLELEPPSFDSILLSGLWFQIFNVDHQPFQVDSAGALTEAPEDLASALIESGVFDVDQNTFMTITVADVESLILVAPLLVTQDVGQGPTIGWVVVGEPLGFRNTIIGVVDQTLRLFGLVGVALAVWGGWLLAGRALSPVERIRGAAGTIASSDGAVSLSKRLDVPDSGDELNRLAYTFNVMLDRIETAFNAQRRFVSDASHELRTPLTSVRGNVDVLVRQLESDRPIYKTDIVEELGVVQRESGRMSRLIEDLLVLARSDAPSLGDFLKLRAVSLDILAREAFRTAHQLGKGQELKLDAGDPVTLHGDGDRLIQVMLILLDNAIRHTPVNGTVEMIVDRSPDDTGNGACARIRVCDTGSGIAARHVPHLCERFYRAEDARSRASGGTGLGLSIALSIVRGHHGWIDVDTAPGKGTTFTVWLPLAANANPPPDQPIQEDDSTVNTIQRRYRQLREGAYRSLSFVNSRRSR